LPKLTQILAKISTGLQNNSSNQTQALPADPSAPNQDLQVALIAEADLSPSLGQKNKTSASFPLIPRDSACLDRSPQETSSAPDQTTSQKLTALNNLAYTLDPVLSFFIKIKEAHQDC
jgi:hypothetical protein